MIALGIEGTAHTLSIGIVEDTGKILCNIKDMYKPPLGWGIKPMEAAKHHEEVREKVLKSALEEAKIKWEDIDIISFSQGPGLPPCLHKTLDFAKELSEEYRKPLYGVNHPLAHIEIGKLTTNCKDPIVLYVSGGNSQVITKIENRYAVMGETMDIGIGNALDKFARGVGIGFPGGPEIEKLALNGKYIELPYTVKGMDLAFTGIVTEAAKKVKSGEKLEDVCFSLQETCFAMLVEVTERALAHTGKTEVLLTGGVAANSRLREMLDIMCRERGAEFYSVPKEYSGDNGAMIAWLGVLSHKSKQGVFGEKVSINPTWRADDVDVRWQHFP